MSIFYTTKIFTLLLLFFVIESRANPNFDWYLVSPVAPYKKHSLVLEKKDQNIRTILIRASKQKVNFCGKYILFTYSCGGGCLDGGVINAKTGRFVSKLPAMYETTDDLGAEFEIKYRKNSRLLVVSGKKIDPVSLETYDFNIDYYEFKDNGFVSINE